MKMIVPEWSVRFIHMRKGIGGFFREETTGELPKYEPTTPKNNLEIQRSLLRVFSTSASCFPAGHVIYIYMYRLDR